jgi:phospholipid/cholesterol/gamma-HCH transport system permease protein
MLTLDIADSRARRIGRAALAWVDDWRRLAQSAAVLLVLAVSPSSYRGARRPVLAREIVLGIGTQVAWFGALSALLALVLIRIIVVTAAGLGLAQYSLELLIRMLALELIPLAAALFAALRIALPKAGALLALRGRSASTSGAPDVLFLQREVLPRAVASALAVLLLVAVSGVLTLLLAYGVVHGGSTGGLANFNHTVGRTMAPAMATVFVLKTLLFAGVVGLLPLAAALRRQTVAGSELGTLARLFSLLLLIQIAALIGNYA